MEMINLPFFNLLTGKFSPLYEGKISSLGLEPTE